MEITAVVSGTAATAGLAEWSWSAVHVDDERHAKIQESVDLLKLSSWQKDITKGLFRSCSHSITDYISSPARFK